MFRLAEPEKTVGKLGANNWWLNQTVPKIPLGKVSRVYDWEQFKWIKVDPELYNQVAWMRYPFHQGKHISDTMLIAGGTGSGKSVMRKVIECFISMGRPIIDLDWKGSDSHLMHYQNSQPKNIPPQTKPMGIPGTYLYYPCAGSRPKKEYEIAVRPNLAKYNTSQLQALGFSPGAAKYFRTIIKRYGPFKNMEDLYQFIEYFPQDDGKSKSIIRSIRSGRIKLRHHRIYKANDTINQNSKESIKKVLPGIMEKKIFRLDNKEEFNFKLHYLRGQNIFYSFNDKEVGRVEINFLMKQIEIVRAQYPQSPKYVVFIEEAHKVLAKQNKAPGQSGDSISEVLEDFILVCRKIGVGLCLVMPEVKDLGSRVLDDLKNIIVGKFKGDNASILIKTMNDHRSRIIPFLKYNRFLNEREMLYYNQDYDHISIFQPFNSPAEIHRE